MKNGLLFCVLGILTACSSEPDVEQVNYYEDVKPIVDTKCATCHLEGGVAPFPLRTYEDVFETRALVANSISNGTMPPWPPDNECNEYHYDRSLTDEEAEIVLTWADGAAAEGPVPLEITYPDPPESLLTDVVLNLEEPYAPQAQPDDYRCHVLEWPEEETTFITGYEVHPDQAHMVHHVIAFGIPPEQVEAVRGYDEADDGPGYTCFGSPYPAGADGVSSFRGVRWLGSWAPGGAGREFPAGTGIKMQPGSLVVIQVHYNTTTAESTKDNSSMSFRTESTVERPALIVPYANPAWILGAIPMTIPAGESSVTHGMSYDVISANILSYFGETDIDGSNGLEIHNVGLHMHELGRRGILSIEREAGNQECLLDIPNWDFNWQGAYFLQDPTVIRKGDKLSLQCEWDNSAENQPVIDGVKQEPKDVEWGEGTGDEMCLGILYVTEPE